jgi:hypothetical protein
MIQGDTKKGTFEKPKKIEEFETCKTFYGDSKLLTVPLIHGY